MVKTMIVNSKTQNREIQKNKQYISQSDVPNFPLNEALRIPQAISEHYGKSPTKPLRVAEALELSPSSSRFRMLCGAAIAYGLTDGGYNAESISLTALGRRTTAPTKEGDDYLAKREAILKPRIMREFLEKYNNSSLPRNDIAYNVLEEMGVPKEKAKQTLDLILESANDVGFLRQVKDKKYVDLEKVGETQDSAEIAAEEIQKNSGEADLGLGPVKEEETDNQLLKLKEDSRAKKVFITHGKNKEFIEPVKKLLNFGELTPIVATERQSVSQPIPDKVMSDMRECGAAIIHVEGEEKVMTPDVEEKVILNPNVLIEIGAAMALYGRRFILLVKDGIKLPTNLQGLYEVRYQGETLDGDTTIRLLEAIKDIKNHPIP